MAIDLEDLTDGEYLDIVYEVLGKDKVEEIIMSWYLKEVQGE